MMVFLQGILARFAASIADLVWTKLEAKLIEYNEKRSQINAISTEASALKGELKNASSDAERVQILRKIGAFSERLGS